jgi:hypothetical protein
VAEEAMEEGQQAMMRLVIMVKPAATCTATSPRSDQHKKQYGCLESSCKSYRLCSTRRSDASAGRLLCTAAVETCRLQHAVIAEPRSRWMDGSAAAVLSA